MTHDIAALDLFNAEQPAHEAGHPMAAITVDSSPGCAEDARY